MIKEFLSSLQTPINDNLPLGAINELAEMFNYDPKTIGRMLRGYEGFNDDNVVKVATEAIRIIKSEALKNIEYADLLEKEMQEFLASKAA